MPDMDREIKETCCSSAESKLHHFSRLCTFTSSEIVFLSKDMISSLWGIILISFSAVKPGSVQILNYDIYSQIFEDYSFQSQKILL